ncbi:transcription factor FAMA isoform X2 [Ziziphus jujuba]|uniref:Transcription factor FAMA isoform X2 n=1 Tax=Ziziphus jujuba TaxID=326968 RepID=A0ABM3IPV9_ZIZJJ|nr:transcription factor FAMA isoform X2 [Ziziphus jujuba]
MEKEENYSASMPPNNFTALDYTIDLHNPHHHHHHQHFLLKSHVGETTNSGDNNSNNDCMVGYMLSNPQQQQQQQQQQFCGSSSLDKLSFADVMQFADFGPKLALNQTKISDVESGMDPVYSFLKFPVLNDKFEDQSLQVAQQSDQEERFKAVSGKDNIVLGDIEEGAGGEDDEARVGNTTANASLQQLQFLGEDPTQIKNPSSETKNKRKRPRTIKTSEEVESQRMTHIAVERNRRKQMNEHLRVLRSLMPGSYVQRGDQASIIGGAIEFVRELEQLLQCLESQKRRRIMGEAQRQVGDNSANIALPQQHTQQQQQTAFPPLQTIPTDQIRFVDFETGLTEETAEKKSVLADVEVKLLGFDAMIKILSRRRPGQLIKTIAALEDLQFNILHTNITTIEQTVLYSFNVKIGSESRFTAEDIATSVQQIFSFIHANSSI